MEKHEEYWNKCQAIIRDNITESAYNTWFAPLTAVNYANGVLVLRVPSQYFAEYIEEHYVDLLRRVIYRVIRPGTKLEYSVVIDQTSGAGAKIPSQHVAGVPLKAPVIKNQRPVYHPQRVELPDLDPQLNPSYNFNTFVEGRCNRLARTAGISIANDPGNNAFNPLFLYGPSGVGKTHVGNAIGIMSKQLHPEKRVLYVSAATFQQQYTEAVRANTLNDFLNFYQTIDVLIIDDVHEFAGKTATQNTFFHIFNHLHLAGKQLILTCDRAPMELAGIEQRLLTRFKWGLSAYMDRPDCDLRRDILRSKIYRDGLEISDEVVEYIAQNVQESIRDLEGVLVSLMAHSTLLNTPINLDLAQQVVGRIVRTKKDISIEKVRDVVCEFYHVTIEEISSKSRLRHIADARQVAMYLSKTLTGEPYATIGMRLGGRNHTTVMHACSVVTDQMTVDNEFANLIENITRKINA
ncbi:MAG: chromosomal replication initiator protein DnaA [Paludibacteraceae bacterium]|nr:chromosomal replication initiator protein DnaA [Paludibacteraceae bacterium]